MKKFLSMALAAAMTMSLATVAAGATSFTDDASIDNKEAVGVLSAVGVLNGMTDGSYAPDGILTREQAAKIIAYAVLGQKAADKLGVESAPFADVAANRWSAPFVSYCVNEGIVAGVGGNKFAPEAQLTGYQFAKMVLVAMGYDAAVEGMTGNSWSIAVAKLVDKKDLDEDIDAALSAPLTRQFAAQMLLNAAGQYTVEYDTKGTSIEINGAKIATGASKAEDTTDLFMADMKAFDDVKNAGATTDAFGRVATKWSHEDWAGDLVFADAADYTIVVGETDKLSEILKDNKLDKKVDKTTAASTTEYKAGTVLELYIDEDNNDATTIVSYSYGASKLTADVKTLSSTKDEAAYDDGARQYIRFSGKTVYDIQAAGLKMDGMEKDDYVVYAAQNGNMVADTYSLSNKDTVTTAYFLSAAKVVTGELTSVKGIEYVKVDGVKYLFNQNVVGSFAGKAGDTYNLYLDPNGFVVAAEVEEDAAADLGEVYLFNSSWTEAKTKSTGSDKYFAQLVALDGSVKEVQLETAFDSLKGQLVTIEDKKDSAKDYKANDGKYTVEAWANADYAVKSEAAVAIESDDTKFDGMRLTSATKYVLVAGEDDDTVVTTKVGGFNYDSAKADNKLTSAYVIYDKDDSAKKALYVVLNAVSEDAEEGATAASDLVYVKATKTQASLAAGDGYIEADVYFTDGAKKTIAIDDSFSGDLNKGFYEYSVNADGYYELEAYSTNDLKANADWDDEAGVVADVTFVELYEGLLTVAGAAGKYQEINAADAAFVNFNDEDYTIDSLEELADMIDDGDEIKGATMTLNVNEDGVVTVFVTKLALNTAN